MQTWEYANQSFTVGDPEAELRGINRLGAEGWEIYAVTTGISTFNVSIATYYCKRPLGMRGSDQPKPPLPDGKTT